MPVCSLLAWHDLPLFKPTEQFEVDCDLWNIFLLFFLLSYRTYFNLFDLFVRSQWHYPFFWLNRQNRLTGGQLLPTPMSSISAICYVLEWYGLLFWWNSIWNTTIRLRVSFPWISKHIIICLISAICWNDLAFPLISLLSKVHLHPKPKPSTI